MCLWANVFGTLRAPAGIIKKENGRRQGRCFALGGCIRWPGPGSQRVGLQLIEHVHFWRIRANRGESMRGKRIHLCHWVNHKPTMTKSYVCIHVCMDVCMMHGWTVCVHAWAHDAHIYGCRCECLCKGISVVCEFHFHVCVFAWWFVASFSRNCWFAFMHTCKLQKYEIPNVNHHC